MRALVSASILSAAVFSAAACTCGGALVVKAGDGGLDAGGLDAGGPGDGGPGDGGPCVDGDGDGYGPGCSLGPDCDDADPAIHPGALEMCADGKDNNCDGQIDESPCGCTPSLSRECYGGPGGTDGVGPCHHGQQRCDSTFAWGPCVGVVLPTAEFCDGQDNNCNGAVDEGQLNACGACGATPGEACGDSLDNDCNGTIDDGCGTCDPQCQCDGGACACHPPTHQPCYGGSPQTGGVGACVGGRHDCVLQANGSYAWSACVGEVVPTALSCNGKDNDCNGTLDDAEMSCPCLVDGALRGCGSNVGECRAGTQVCAGGQWGACTGGVALQPELCDSKDNDCDGLTDEGVTNLCGGCGAAPAEVCGDGLDNNCSGTVDEGCGCGGLNNQACYGGPSATRGVGPCHAGLQYCVRTEVEEHWGPCTGDVKPLLEVCGDGVDNDCDGQVDDNCNCPEGQTRACGTDVGLCQKGTQTCTQGAWTTCVGGVVPTAEVCDGQDNNCNGLVDEGVLNACGTCPPAPCYTQDYNTPGTCAVPGRTCTSVVPDSVNPSAITLGDLTNALLPYIYISVTNLNLVAQLNTETGVKQWEMPSYGMNPSRTAVALDGTVWVGNRCLVSGLENDFTCSSMAHLDLNGNLICRADVPGWVRGVAIDADGYAWAGTWNGMSVWKVSGTQVDTTQSPPRCQIAGSLSLGVPVYGVAIDGRGFLWTASSPTQKVNTALVQLVDSVPNPYYYGVAIDSKNRVWFGGWNGSGDMHRIDGDPPYANFSSGVTGITAVTVHPDGTVWGSSYGGSTLGVVKLTLDAPGTTLLSTEVFADPEGLSNHGVAVDKAGKLWSPQVWAQGRVNRWTPAGVREARFDVDVGQELYTYSDMTGIQLRTITLREGTWVQDYDSSYVQAIWDHAEWTAIVPAGTEVAVQARAADTEAAFAAGAATAWCGPFTTSPASFAGCAFLNHHRWLQLEVKLSTTTDGVKPSVSDVKVLWSY